eukprot:ctg_3519.g398
MPRAPSTRIPASCGSASSFCRSTDCRAAASAAGVAEVFTTAHHSRQRRVHRVVDADGGIVGGFRAGVRHDCVLDALSERFDGGVGAVDVDERVHRWAESGVRRLHRPREQAVFAVGERRVVCPCGRVDRGDQPGGCACARVCAAADHHGVAGGADSERPHRHGVLVAAGAFEAFRAVGVSVCAVRPRRSDQPRFLRTRASGLERQSVADGAQVHPGDPLCDGILCAIRSGDRTDEGHSGRSRGPRAPAAEFLGAVSGVPDAVAGDAIAGALRRRQPGSPGNGCMAAAALRARTGRGGQSLRRVRLLYGRLDVLLPGVSSAAAALLG